MTAFARPRTRLIVAAAALPLSAVLVATGTGSASAQTAECGRSVTTLLKDTITATGHAPLTVQTTPNTTVDLFAYTRPSTTYKLVRTAQVGDDGQASFSVAPGGNTRMYAQQRGCTANPPADSVVLNVRPKLTLNVDRVGTRSYTFYGNSLPVRDRGMVVHLYRVTADGSQVLTAMTRSSSTTGQWRINRTFSGTGRFGFVLRTSQDISNAAGASNLQSVLIY